MTQNNITSPATAATYQHETMSRKDFRAYIANVFGHRGERGLILKAPYRYIEYFSAPAGLIVLAHHDDYTGQVDGIHPVSLSGHVEGLQSIIEPLSPNSRYAAHYLPRKWQGQLVLAAFGRQIKAGAPEAPSIETDDGFFSLEIFDAPTGPIVGVLDGKSKVHVIRPAAVEPCVRAQAPIRGAGFIQMTPEDEARIASTGEAA